MKRWKFPNDVDLDQFRHRLLVDAVFQAQPATWQRRARAFDRAAPQPGDFTGQATPAELKARARRCADTAGACGARATSRHVLTDQDEWLLEHVLPFAPVTEPPLSMIARHERVLAALDEHKLLVTAGDAA